MGLNFIMEDYSTGMIDTIDEVKNAIWNSKYTFTKIYSTIEFEPRIEELCGSEELYSLFGKYSKLQCINVKSKYLDDNMVSYDFIRIHVNNTWAYVCEKDCYLPKEYYKRMHYAKALYFETVKKISKGEKIDITDLADKLNTNYLETDRIKLFANNRKMNISWSEYVDKVNMYLDRISVNFKPVDVYEEENPDNDIDFENLIGYTDDNYAVSYINKSLTGYFRTEYIKNMGLPTNGRNEYKECVCCGKFILKGHHLKKYCSDCSKEKTFNNKKKYDKKRIRK
jgi:hypothetical protein